VSLFYFGGLNLEHHEHAVLILVLFRIESGVYWAWADFHRQAFFVQAFRTSTAYYHLKRFPDDLRKSMKYSRSLLTSR
jgi:hypothetical protein